MSPHPSSTTSLFAISSFHSPLLSAIFFSCCPAPHLYRCVQRRTLFLSASSPAHGENVGYNPSPLSWDYREKPVLLYLEAGFNSHFVDQGVRTSCLWLEQVHPIQPGKGLESQPARKSWRKGTDGRRKNHINMQRECSRFIAAKWSFIIYLFIWSPNLATDPQFHAAIKALKNEMCWNTSN